MQSAIVEHTETCGINCNSKLQVEHSGGVLIDDIRFLTIKEDGSEVEQSIRNYEIKYWGNIPEFNCYNHLIPNLPVASILLK